MFISSIVKDAPNVTTPGFESTNERDSQADASENFMTLVHGNLLFAAATIG